MNFEATLKFARKCDKADELAKFRKLFHFPGKDKQSLYLCGNSLGLLSKGVKASINQELKDWKEQGIKGYLGAKNPWMTYHHNFKRPLARIVGAKEEEVTVMNALTVNIHLLMASFYRPTKTRFKILMEAGAFPSDQYAVESQVRYHGYSQEEAVIEIAPRENEKLIREEDILQAIEANKDQLALVFIGGINYYTGQLFDIAGITAAAHAAGAIAGFDLAHAVGNVTMELHDWNVDFAAWCSYKYLNGGPGSASGIFVHEMHGNNPELVRFAGWWGNDDKTRFLMEKGFIPQQGADGWNISTAQVFNMAPLKASLEIIDRAGIQNLREKSIALTGYLEFLINSLNNPNYYIISPRDPQKRGAQLSVFVAGDAKEIYNKIVAKGIVIDYREPSVIRISPAPLYNSFVDVFRFYKALSALDKH